MVVVVNCLWFSFLPLYNVSFQAACFIPPFSRPHCLAEDFSLSHLSLLAHTLSLFLSLHAHTLSLFSVPLIPPDGLKAQTMFCLVSRNKSRERMGNKTEVNWIVSVARWVCRMRLPKLSSINNIQKISDKFGVNVSLYQKWRNYPYRLALTLAYNFWSQFCHES